MVSTIKFSQMTDGGNLANNQSIPGLLDGENVLFTFPGTYIQWLSAVTTAITPAVNTGYYVTEAAQVTFTLPVTAPVGSVFAITGNGAGGWVLRPGAGQTIKLIASSASTSITTAERYDCIEVMCTVADTTWVVRSYTSTGFTIV